jgi:glycogen debranching enzyme
MASENYYNQIWARDSFITFIGSNLLADEALTKTAKATVETFAKTSTELGQIANFYDPETKTADYGHSGATDATAWYVIGLCSLFEATQDWSLLKHPFDVALEGMNWLRYQDSNNTLLIDSPQGGDWMDAAIQRTGKTLYNNALFLMATKCANKMAEASGRPTDQVKLVEYDKLLARFNDVFLPGPDSPSRMEAFWPKLAREYEARKPMDFARTHYIHYVSFGRFDTRFDTLSNVLCILSKVADDESAKSILEFVKENKLARPYPIQVLDRPYTRGEMGYDGELDETLPVQHRSTAFRYHNAGVWPFVGALYVCALFQVDDDYARRGLLSLASANQLAREGEQGGFNEWIDPKARKAMGQTGQSWNAGTYIAAYLASKGSNPFQFLE